MVMCERVFWCLYLFSMFKHMKNNHMVFGIAGEPGAGKDTVKEYLVHTYGSESFGFSLILKDILLRLSMELCRENYARLAEALRASFGEHILAKVLTGDIARLSNPLIVIDGIRKFGELEELRKLPNFHFIFMETDLRVRYERIKNRGTKADDSSKTFEEFVRDHEHAADRDVRNLKEYADIVIENNGTREDLFAQVDARLLSLGVDRKS